MKSSLFLFCLYFGAQSQIDSRNFAAGFGTPFILFKGPYIT